MSTTHYSNHVKISGFLILVRRENGLSISVNEKIIVEERPLLYNQKEMVEEKEPVELLEQLCG
jgi:hypothetical protein